MTDNWYARHNPAAGGIAVTTAGSDRCATPSDAVERAQEDDRWPPGVRILFMVGAATSCWAVIGLIAYLLW